MRQGSALDASLGAQGGECSDDPRDRWQTFGRLTNRRGPNMGNAPSSGRANMRYRVRGNVTNLIHRRTSQTGCQLIGASAVGNRVATAGEQRLATHAGLGGKRIPRVISQTRPRWPGPGWSQAGGSQPRPVFRSAADRPWRRRVPPFEPLVADAGVRGLLRWVGPRPIRAGERIFDPSAMSATSSSSSS